MKKFIPIQKISYFQKWKWLAVMLLACCFSLNLSAQDCCDQGDKVRAFTFTYIGGACPGNNSQGSKSDCTGGSETGNSVSILASKDENGGGDQYFSQTVSLGETFTVNASGSEFPSKIFIRVGNQLNEIHASCSAPVIVGETYGALRLDFVEFKNGVQCGPPPPPECDNVTDGGEITGNESNCGPSYDPSIITSVEEATGNSNPGGGGNTGEDCCENGGDKVREFTFTYVGGACPGNNSQGSKSDCTGGSETGATVTILATEDDDGSGDQYFSGTVSIGETFVVQATEDDFPSKIFVRVGNQLNEIHASCSAPVIPGETYGALLLVSAEFKNGYTCGMPPTPPVDYQWISSTSGCPNNINQAIAGATGAAYDPSTITQTTYYVRLAKREYCESETVGDAEGWIASNCVIKTVQNCDPCINQGGDSDGDGVCNNQDCLPFDPNFPATPGTPCNDGNPNTVNDIVQSDGCSCAGTPVDPCLTQGGDSDGDGVCNFQDCLPFDPNFPATPGTPCNDGNPNTVNDLVQGDGCSCAGTPVDPCVNQGGDSDGDGVCNNQDCQPFDPNFPATPGTPCNDGNPNTINDVVQGDGCSCAGTPTSDPCDDIDISITTDDKIRVTGQSAAPISQIQVFNTAWSEVFNCSANCTDPQMIMLPAGTYYVYVKLYNNGWSPICQVNETVTITPNDPCINQGGDTDGDGVCNNQDCQPFNPNFPTTPGTACDDGNPNTFNDVVQADGCSCAGTPVDPCINQGGDSDGDGVCNNQDCQPFNPFYPTTPGTACNDGNPNTVNDVVQADGCSCAGTPVDPCINQGGDTDGDGVCDNQDNCVFVANPGQEDSDGDGVGNACDTVTNICDNIAITITADNKIRVSGHSAAAIAQIQVFNSGWSEEFNCSGTNCPDPQMISVPTGTYYVYVKLYTSTWSLICQVNKTVTVTGGGDPCANQGGDSDGDGICDFQDNCDFVPNPGQEDSDWDGIGDACDTTDPCQGQGGDTDGDGICDQVDNCRTLPNPYQEDTDGDGIGDVCDEPSTGDDCDNVVFHVNHASITVSGLHSAPISMLVIFDEHWSTVFSCAGDCNNVETINNLSAGVYYVRATLLDQHWREICDKDAYLICGATSFKVKEPSPKLHLETSQVDRAVALSWTTNTDFKTNRYVIEHSMDKVNFAPLKENASETNAADFVHYNDKDVAPELGKNYYRIKQYYLDGSFVYSQVREVKFELDLQSVMVYPNPASNVLQLNAKQLLDYDFEVEIVNFLGQPMVKKEYEKNSDATLRYNLDKFTPGLYQLRILVEGQRQKVLPFAVIKL